MDVLETTVKEFFPTEWISKYNEILSYGNPHSKGLPLMNPFHVLLIAIGYLLSVFIGKAIMKNRDRLEMKLFSTLHNVFLILLSSYMCLEILRQAFIVNTYSLFGNGVDSSPKGLGMAHVLWIYYASKPVEFIDTWIMILKKNNRQISFLHVYHHVTIFIIWWAVVYFAPGGESYFSAAQNSFIHVLMYSYYLLSSFGVKLPKSFITMSQMLQFLLNMIQATYDILFPHPKYPLFLARLLFCYMISLLVLFANFFVKDRQRGAVEKQKAQ